MTTQVRTVSVRLPSSLKAAIEQFATAHGMSMSQFLATAAAEKLMARGTAEAWFAERRGKGDIDAAIRFLKRQGTEAPLPEDVL